MHCPRCERALAYRERACLRCGQRLAWRVASGDAPHHCGRCGEPCAAGDGACAACAAPRLVAQRAGRPWGQFGARLATVFSVALVLLLGARALPILTGSGFQTAAYVPSDAWLYTTMTVQPSITQMRNLGGLVDAFTSQPGYAEARAQINTESTRDTDFSFQDEVWPLLDGEIAFAA